MFHSQYAPPYPLVFAIPHILGSLKPLLAENYHGTPHKSATQGSLPAALLAYSYIILGLRWGDKNYARDQGYMIYDAFYTYVQNKIINHQTMESQLEKNMEHCMETARALNPQPVS